MSNVYKLKTLNRIFFQYIKTQNVYYGNSNSPLPNIFIKNKPTMSKLKSNLNNCQCKMYNQTVEKHTPFFVGSGLPEKYLRKKSETGKIF